MDYLFRYAIISAPSARNDGSAQVAHDMAIVTLPDDGTSYNSSDWRSAPWAPGHHKTFMLPGADLSAALSSGDNSQKVAAYKQLLRDNYGTQAEPLETNWVLGNMELFMDNNDVSTVAAAEADTFIMAVDPGAYPVTFTL